MCVCLHSAFSIGCAPDLIELIRKTNTAGQCSAVLEDGRVTTRNPFASASHQEAHQVLKRKNQLRLRDCGGNTQDKQEERERERRG